MVESGDAPSYDEVLAKQTEHELTADLSGASILYLDFFTGDLDHEAHATSQPAALLSQLRSVDAVAGRIFTTIQRGPLAGQTIFAVVSDHGMNNEPGIISQTFSLPDLLNSPDGGAHHVVTNRHQLSDFKLKGLDPMVHRVVSPSANSFYLAGESSKYPTAWLDLDGNERAAVHLRNNDLNKLHILLLSLARKDTPVPIRRAAAGAIRRIIDHRRVAWTSTLTAMAEEMNAVEQAVAQRKQSFSAGGRMLRLRIELDDWQTELSSYRTYMSHLRALLAFVPDPDHTLKEKIDDLIPNMSMGDNNSVADLQRYVAGPSSAGIFLDARGDLDEERSYRFVDYPALFLGQRGGNLPQRELPRRPIDFAAMRLPDPGAARHAYWLYRGPSSQLIIESDGGGRISVNPVQDLTQDANGKVVWKAQAWMPGLPLQIFEDPELAIPATTDRRSWLSSAHTEREWFEAIHRCRYSNGVIGIVEELSPIADAVPGPAGASATLVRYERRRRELVQADLHLFAADHWNFNTRFPNPGGNHGSFLRISTHSVWMMAGPGIPAGQRIERPYDSLNFASTLLNLLGLPAPLPDRVVHFGSN